MKKNKLIRLTILACIIFIVMVNFPITGKSQENNEPVVYKVQRLLKLMKIDGNWNKKEWQKIKALDLSRYIGAIPPFRPTTQAKIMYDDNNIYVIFVVHDRYVHSVVEVYNGPVSGDACVEFFFSPDTAFAQRYFNLETNAGGTPLMAYHVFSQKEYQRFTPAELDRIEIAHSLPKKIDPEITEPVTWTLEYKLPLELMEKYSSVIRPKAGTVWRANFYKTASKSTNPHWITWSLVDNQKPNFHLPQFFGELLFE